MRKNRGFFARVLVDMDLLFPLADHVLVERSDFAFVADVEYEWLHSFCSHCKMIGHELAQCCVINVVFLDLNISLRQLLKNMNRGRSRFLNNIKSIRRFCRYAFSRGCLGS